MSRASEEPPQPLENMSRAELEATVRKTQLELNNANERATAAEKWAALADTTNREVRRGRPPKRRRHAREEHSDDDEPAEFEPEVDEDDEDDDPAETVRMAGHAFGLLMGLWLRTGEKALRVELNAAYTEESRFDNSKNKIQGELHDALDVLPTELHPRDKRKGWVSNKFNAAVNRQRQEAVGRVRNDIPSVFKTHLNGRIEDGLDLRDAAKRLEMIDLIGGKRNAGGKAEYHILDAPVLHSDGSSHFNKQTFLYNKLLMHVAAAFIFGPTKANNLATGKGAVSNNTRMADLHEITHTTPGIIANAAILTLYTISPDSCFSVDGPQTSLNWKTTHDTILEYVLKGVRLRKVEVLELIRAWDNELFPETETSLADARGAEPAPPDARRRMLEALDAMEEEEETTGGDENPSGEPSQSTPSGSHASARGD